MELDCAPGAKALIAREFDVARSTLTRDIRPHQGRDGTVCGEHVRRTPLRPPG